MLTFPLPQHLVMFQEISLTLVPELTEQMPLLTHEGHAMCVRNNMLKLLSFLTYIILLRHHSIEMKISSVH